MSNTGRDPLSWWPPSSRARRCLVVGDGRSAENYRESLTGRMEMIGVHDVARAAGLEYLASRVGDERIDVIALAIPPLSARQVRDVLTAGERLRLGYVVIEPGDSATAKEGRPRLRVRQPTAEDLVRQPSPVLSEPDGDLFEGRTVAVTGGAGSIGSEICRQLSLAGAREIVPIDHDGNQLYRLTRSLESVDTSTSIRPELADVRDVTRLSTLFERHRPSVVFHAAAQKQVPLLEFAACEAVKTNVGGTRTVATLARDARVERFVFVSTDKAVRPTSVMGASKRVGEMIVHSISAGSATVFRSVRFGNVLDTSGSLIPIICDQILNGGPVTVTDPNVSRYVMTVGEAVALVLEASGTAAEDLLVLEMGSPVRIRDLARQMIVLAGKIPDDEIAIRYTGLRPGEKLHEQLLDETEAKLSRRCGPRMLTVAGPPSSAGLDDRVSRLLETAQHEDEAGVREQLAKLVPGFPGSDPTREIPCGSGGRDTAG